MRGLSIYSELWQVRISNVVLAIGMVSCHCGPLWVGIPNVQHLKRPHLCKITLMWNATLAQQKKGCLVMKCEATPSPLVTLSLPKALYCWFGFLQRIFSKKVLQVKIIMFIGKCLLYTVQCQDESVFIWRCLVYTVQCQDESVFIWRCLLFLAQWPGNVMG